MESKNITQVTYDSTNGPNELHDDNRRSTLSDYTASNRQSFNSDHIDDIGDSSDGDNSIPANSNEIGPIELQKLNKEKSNDRVAPIKKYYHERELGS